MKKGFSNFNRRKVVLAFADCVIIGISAIITGFFLSVMGKSVSDQKVAVSMPIYVVCCVMSLVIFGAYKKMWRYFKKKDYLSCVFGNFIGCVITNLFLTILDVKINLLYVILFYIISLFGICSFRFMFKRTFLSLTSLGRKDSKKKRTMIIGAGQAGTMILSEIRSNCKDERHTKAVLIDPICILDDDVSKIGMNINGVDVVGRIEDIHRFVKEFEIEQIIFAIPSCSDNQKQYILNECSSTNLPVKVIPFLGDLVFNSESKSIVNQMRDIKIEDLLERESVSFDNKDIKNFISGKVCMVTGGGGSIGSELVRQIAKFSPKQIIIVDIYENNAYDIQQELKLEYGDSLNLVTLIASVRDYFRMNCIYEKYKPQIVFHAAAHKHVPLMEASPMEAIKNNVIGTFNTATLAEYHDVEKFVMISTDKAVNPTNVMGASKRCCEMIIQMLSQHQRSNTEFVTTRFGNVLGSNGSVIPLFKRQIEKGGPVTVTHPDIIRYFMTIPEAVNLVMQAAAIANGGEIFVLDMGKPVKIVTLAENLIRMYGKVPYTDIEIKFTGLRPGEKIKEELLMNEEGLKKTSNELIFIGNQIEINTREFIDDLRDLKSAAKENDDALAIKALHKIVPTFITPEEFNSKELSKIKQ